MSETSTKDGGSNQASPVFGFAAVYGSAEILNYADGKNSSAGADDSYFRWRGGLLVGDSPGEVKLGETAEIGGSQPVGSQSRAKPRF